MKQSFILYPISSLFIYPVPPDLLLHFHVIKNISYCLHCTPLTICVRGYALILYIYKEELQGD